MTLHLKKPKGDIYLVIENQEAMKKFLYFLIYSMETVDGNRGSATELLKLRVSQACQNSKGNLEKVKRMVKHQIALSILKKYSLLICRMKISYQALIRKSTFLELFVRQIITSFKFLKETE